MGFAASLTARAELIYSAQVPVVNPLARELVFKIVYYGPGLGGKTTTLQFVHAETRPEHRGKMVSLATPVDRTLYFDYLPIRVPNVRELAVRLQLFTVPGQVYYNATRKLVLTGADGVVFVADSQRLRADANQESFDNLRDNLREHGRELGEMPFVLQFNKRDLADVLSEEELAQALNPQGAPAFHTVATQGEGVFEALEAITRLVLEEFESRVPDVGTPELGRLAIPEGGLAEALRRAEGVEPTQHPTPPPPRFRPSGVLGLGLSESPPGAPPPRIIALEPGSELGSSSTPEERLGPLGGALPSREHPPTADPPAAADAPPERGEQERVSAEAPLPLTRLVSTRAESSGAAWEAGPDAPEANDEEPPSVASHTTGLSFVGLWPANERAMVLEVEDALAAGEVGRAVAGCDRLVARSLAGVAHVVGATSEAPRDPTLVALLLGVRGRRYLDFRLLVRDVRAGRKPTVAEALAAFSLAIELRISRAAVTG